METITKIYNRYKWKKKMLGQNELARQHNKTLKAAINETEKLTKQELLQLLQEIRKKRYKGKSSFYGILKKRGIKPGEYNKEMIKARGFKNMHEYQEAIAIKQGYNSRWDMYFNKYFKKKWPRPIDMLNERAKKRGFADYKAYEDFLARNRGFEDKKAYRRSLYEKRNGKKEI